MVKLNSFFSDGMVVGKKSRLWGWGKPGQIINVNFLCKNYEAICDQNGRFDVELTAKEFGGPHTMTVGDKIINDVYVGKVWFCGGQSNMETPLSRTRLLLGDYIKEDSRIRFFQAEKGVKFDKPATDVKGKWRTAENNMDELFAVPYFFARQLAQDDHTPIGLLCTPAGGTPIEGWLPEEIIKKYPRLYNQLLQVKDEDFVARITKESSARAQAWREKLNAADTGLAENWQSLNYDDTNWESRMLLDTSGLPKHGAVWYRKSVVLPKVEGTVLLNLGRIENSVKVYVNGQQVFAVDYMYPPCVFPLPANLFCEGENLIALRVVGDGNSPKFVPGKEYSLSYGQLPPGTNALSANYQTKIDLNSPWKRRTGCETAKAEPGVWFYNRPCGVYNFMLAPLLGCSLDGIIWYQGESNTMQWETYKTLFTEFVTHIRDNFHVSKTVGESSKEDLCIIFTQLANYATGGGSGWPLLREQQRKCLEIPNTAMAVTIDCGEYNDLHPTDKKTVGERLALCARELVYKQDVVSHGPVVKKVICENGILTIYFRYGAGLWAKDGYPIIDVVDADGHVHKFYAIPQNETLVANIGGIKPKTVRFGWADCPAVAVYNAYNLPASPFEVRV